ncbi:hypothetical protein HZS_4480 [Henneguya salminicola]|nr:hypothetical protein HZS_4480 [Henneguya salminicola]
MTFLSTPPPFTQCLIIIAYENWKKNRHLSYSILYDVVVLLEHSWMPKRIAIAFVIMFIKASQYGFADSNKHGCYFHLHQSILTKLNVSKEKSKILLDQIILLSFIPNIDLNFVIE